MSVGLSGNLRDFGIADVFQLIGQQRKTGVLELKGSELRIHVAFDQGSVVTAAPAVGRATDADPLGEMLMRCGLLTRERATSVAAECRSSARTFARTAVERGWLDGEEVSRIEDLLTRDTVFEVLRWESGSFDFRAAEVEHERDRSALLPAEQILMDGLRMVDEWQSFAEFVPSDDTVFQRVGRFETYSGDARRSSPGQLAEAERVFLLIDGRLSSRRIIDLSRLGTFDGTAVLADLRRTGVIRPLDPAGVRELRRQARPAGERGERVRAALAAALPLLVLIGAVWATGQRTPAATPALPFRIEGETLASVREAQATRQLSHAVEAFRLAEGRWPARIEDLLARGLVAPEVLARPAGRPYYFAQRSDGVVLLAPER
jgi:hypothetical protein